MRRMGTTCASENWTLKEETWTENWKEVRRGFFKKVGDI